MNEIGHQGVQDARQALGQTYDQVLAKSSANAMEPQFIQNMANLRALVSNPPNAKQRAFDGIIAREFDDGTRGCSEWAYQRGKPVPVKRGLDAAVDRFSKSNDAYQIRTRAGPETGPAGIPRPGLLGLTHKTLKNLPRSTRHMQTSSDSAGRIVRC